MTRTTPWLGILAALLVALFAADRDAAARATAAGGPHANLAANKAVGEVPAGPATIRGRVVHRSRPEAAGDVPVTLLALDAAGRAGTRRTQTGPGGEFAFEKLSNDPGTVYLLAVRHAGIPFGARVSFDEGEIASSSVIEISDTSADAHELGIGAASLRVDRGCNGVRITETHTLRNPTEFILRVPPGERATREPIFRIELPAAASFFTPGRGSLEEDLLRQGNQVVFWGPLHPGSHEVEFAYSIPAGDETLAFERRFPRGVEKAVVMTWVNGPAARGEGLRAEGEMTLDGVSYATLESRALAPGQSVAFSLDLGAIEPSAERLSMPEVRMWLELDDAALDVRERYELAVSGDTPLRSDSDAPLLCLPLPPGAEGIRFSAESFAMGIQPDATGGLALRGPIPPGKSGFALSYLLRSGSDGIRFARDFPIGLSLLSLMIADTGVQTTTDRLHRRQPVRTSDRSYIHLEAFEIEPGETITLDLESIPPRQPLPRVATVGFVAAAALLAVVFLAAPLRAPRKTPAAAARMASTAAERVSVYAAIRDLEDDFETGKISAEDHAVMLSELRARAGALLRQERAAGTPPE